MTPAAYSLKPWTEVVRPHDDIVAGELEMATYAADIGAVDRDDPNTPRVYRDPREFFRTTYPTRNLSRLLKDVLSVLGGKPGDRVVQLRTPFGGGKTHSLVALYHLARSRDKINPSDISDLPDPGRARVAVLSGIDLDPRTPREADGLVIHTLWGELAFRLGGEPAYEQVRIHDESGGSPGGDVLRKLLGGGPTLLLLDEVLVYVEKAGGRTGDDPLRRQALLFLQTLTEVVRGLPNAAMVFSLQASAHEAMGDEALFQQLDHLVTRVDAKRQPVDDDEVIRVVQRRLFPGFGEDPAHERVAAEVAREYALAYGRLREALAETASDRRTATVERERLERRIVESYPFHPALLDIMFHRWGSLPSYQRTRGALQFLARVVHALWDGARAAQPLIAPGDVPLEDEHVRGAFFSQVGERERYTSVLAADLTGGGARAADVDRRIASNSPAYEQLRVGTRCAAAVVLYSFGGRDQERGVTEAELVQSLVSPALDRNVLTAALHDLREELLYMHYTGRRYRFEPRPNLNLLIAEETKKWSPADVLDRIRDQLIQTLRRTADQALLWPADSAAVPDEPRFRIVYLGPEWTNLEFDEAKLHVTELVEYRQPARRVYRNSLAFALPARLHLDRARTAARSHLAIESLTEEVKAGRIQVEKEQQEELAQRRRAAASDLTGAIERLYEQVLVPVADREHGAPFTLETIDLRAQLAAGRDLHGRLLDGLRKHVFDTVTPARVATLTRLGTERPFISCEDLVKWFFSIFDFPKLSNEGALRRAVADGTQQTFGYVSAATVQNGEVNPSRAELVRFGERTPDDEIELGAGAFLLAPALAQSLRGQAPTPATDEPAPLDVPPIDDAQPAGASDGPSVYRFSAEASGEQLFRILPAIQNLSDRSSRLVAHLDIEAESQEPFDRSWLRNAVEEQLDEAGVHWTRDT